MTARHAFSTRKRRTRAAVTAATATSLVAAGFLALPSGVAGASTADPTPDLLAGNPTCAQAVAGSQEFKLDGPSSKDGVTTPSQMTDGVQTWTSPSAFSVTTDFDSLLDGSQFQLDFAGASRLVAGVLVKASNQAHLFDYRGLVGGGVAADTFLLSVPRSTDPLDMHAISHVSFCVLPPPALPDPPVVANGITLKSSGTGTSKLTTTWQVSKEVDDAVHAGWAGAADVGTSTWTVTADKTETASDFNASGTFTVKSANATAVPFTASVVVGTATAVVDCGTSAVAPAGPGTKTCSWTANDLGSAVATYTVTVTPTDATIPAAEDGPHAVAWAAPALVGHSSVSVQDVYAGGAPVTLADASGSTVISDDTQFPTYARTYSCPADLPYDRDVNRRTFTNVASLVQDASIKATRSVEVTCTQDWRNETATGKGDRYTTSNWFMYNHLPSADPATFPLIAGQHHTAGSVTLTKGGSISITMAKDFRFAPVLSNVKVHPFSRVPTAKQFVPGSFDYKATASGPSFLGASARIGSGPYFGIHVDVQRLVLHS